MDLALKPQNSTNKTSSVDTLHAALANTGPWCSAEMAMHVHCLKDIFFMCMCALGGQPILGVILRNTVHFFATKPLTEVDAARLDSLG